MNIATVVFAVTRQRRDCETFVADGLLFPDRTPSPGLLDYKKVIEPVRIATGRGVAPSGL